MTNTRFIAAVLGLSFLTMVNSYATDLSIDFIKLRTAKTVTFILVPWSNLSWMHLPQWDESTFKQIGCTYTTQDSAKIGSLIQILERGEIKKNTASEASLEPLKGSNFKEDPREGVYFNFSDGTEARFLFSPELGSNDTSGQFTYSHLYSDYPLKANHALPWYLVYWGAQIGQPTAKDVGTTQECERFIRKNIYLGW